MEKAKLGMGIILLSTVMAFFLMVVYVRADPTDPTGPETLSVDNTSRLDTTNWPAIEIQAEAGNISHLTIDAKTQTQTWQGYFGDITGTITLDDANNNTMYDWYMAEPQGEIYASNSTTVTWDDIECLDYTRTNGGLNLTTVETMYGLAPDDVDGVDETFNVSGKLSDGSTDHPIVYVGTHTIAAGSCPAADTYESDSSAGTNFIEVLLTDNQSIVFTTIIENNIVGNDTDVVGFDGVTHDFQMLVGENGHDGDDLVTPYWFFVELE